MQTKKRKSLKENVTVKKNKNLSNPIKKIYKHSNSGIISKRGKAKTGVKTIQNEAQKITKFFKSKQDPDIVEVGVGVEQQYEENFIDNKNRSETKPELKLNANYNGFNYDGGGI